MFELIIFSSHDKWNSLCWILSVSRQQGGSFKHGSMLSRWEGEQIQAENGRKLGEATEETNIHQIISMRFFFFALKYYNYFHHNKLKKSHLISSPRQKTCREASSMSSRAFPIVSGNVIVPIKRCRKEDALGIQAISLHRVKLFQFRIQAFVLVAQHWELETWHKQHYVL